MKKIDIAILALVATSTLLTAQERYGVKSGIIEYKLAIVGKVMGIDSEISGKSTQYFKNYGDTILTKEKISQTVMDTTHEEEDIYKLKSNTVYNVDLDKKIIFKMKLGDDMKELGMLSASEKNLIKNGGKKIGSEKIAGYTCDNWQVKDEKLCVYKGIPLKITTTQMGMTHTQIATKVEFKSVNDESFKLPDYPIKTEKDMMDDLKNKMTKQMENATPQEKKMMQEMVKKLIENPTGTVSNQ